LVVPSGRPALQLELEIRRQQFRLVEHKDLQRRGGCIRRCVGSIALHPPKPAALLAPRKSGDGMTRVELKPHLSWESGTVTGSAVKANHSNVTLLKSTVRR
jgi:hypothetical protein